MIFLALLLVQGVSSEVCDQQCNCVNLTTPYNTLRRPIGDAQPSTTVNTKFILVTNENTTGVTISARNPININTTTFQPDRWTYFIVHGYWTFSVNNSWQWSSALAHIAREPCNVFITDWSLASVQILYTQAVANTLVVGCEIGRFIKNQNINPDLVHVVGHSLGGQIAGYVGDYVKVARMTGLDPAGPLFFGEPLAVRLDSGDAQYVQALHTDITRLGTRDISGDSDVFLNDGKNQPGCCDDPLNILLNITQFKIGCSHVRATQFYVEAVENNRTYWGHSNYTYVDGSSSAACGKEVDVTTCSCGSCAPFLVDKENKSTGLHYIKTRPSLPLFYDEPQSDEVMDSC